MSEGGERESERERKGRTKREKRIVVIPFRDRRVRGEGEKVVEEEGLAEAEAMLFHLVFYLLRSYLYSFFFQPNATELDSHYLHSPLLGLASSPNYILRASSLSPLLLLVIKYSNWNTYKQESSKN